MPDPSSKGTSPIGLPQAGITEIMGFVEHLKHSGGKQDIYRLASELKMEFGEILKVIQGAEILGLVHTPGGDVEIEPLGEQFITLKISARKEKIKEQMVKLPLFNKIVEFLNEKEEHQASKDQVLEKLAELVPNEDALLSFNTVVGWGRYAELFGYNHDTHMFYLDHGDEQV